MISTSADRIAPEESGRTGNNLAARTLRSFFLALFAIGFAAAPLSAAPDTKPGTKVDFPDIVDWSSLVITHERLGCFGSCPTYRLEIHGDGTVVYNGKAFVTVLGERRSKISADTVRGLYLRFRAADYFALNDRYSVGADCFAAATSIAFDGRHKSVENQCGASKIVSRLEGEIDRAAHVESWTARPSPRQSP